MQAKQIEAMIQIGTENGMQRYCLYDGETLVISFYFDGRKTTEHFHSYHGDKIHTFRDLKYISRLTVWIVPTSKIRLQYAYNDEIASFRYKIERNWKTDKRSLSDSGRSYLRRKKREKFIQTLSPEFRALVGK